MSSSETIYAGATQITDLSASVGLGTIPTVNGNPAAFAWIKPRVSGVYVRLDGAAATSADMLVDVGQPLKIHILNSGGLTNVRALQAAAGAILDIWFGS